MNPEYDELLVLAETLGEVKSKTEKLEAEFSTQARPLEAATNALSAALSGIKALQFHVLDNNLGQLSARVEEMRKAVDEQVGVIALELKKADETNAAKAGQEAEALRSEIAALQAQLGTLGAQFSAQLERVEFSAKEEAKKLQLIPGPAGAAGASLNPRGTFIDGETYNRLDVVSWLGSSYIAAVDGVTEKPSKNSNQWQVLASRGSGGSGGAGDFGSLAGVAQINQGGTGQTTRAAGLNALLPDQAGATQYMLLTDGAGNVSWGAQPVAGLPSQTSNSGKLLTTNGTTASWSNAVTVSGSNATVTGSLNVNGTGLSQMVGNANTRLEVGNAIEDQRAHIGLVNRLNLGNPIFSKNLAGKSASDAYTTIATTAASGYSGIECGYGGVIRLLNGTGATTAGAEVTPIAVLDTNTTRVAIPLTTASTTTSTGALVVGNGTSGGLGVGGSAFIGGAINMYGEDFNIHNVGYGSWTLRNTAGSAVFDIRNGAGSWLTFPGAATGTVEFKTLATTVKISATTASTSPSSGALVVSGGVGVAGAIYAGGNITIDKAAPDFTLTRSVNTNSGLIQLTTSTTYDFAIGLRNTTDSDLHIYNYGTSNDALKIARSDSLATFGGAVRTAAPSGGTAANWKLGTVATVSPTSPNRTIEVDIGGTIYYIHAKTTNN